MPRAAVLGKPVAHSLSPLIHLAGYAAAGLAGWTYTAVECAEDELSGVVAGLGAAWAGLSLTMPLKEVALSVADEVTPLAGTLGAANTLVRRPDGGWRAENTDAPGMAVAFGAVPAGTRVVVLGAGGTARAALGAAAELRAGAVSVVAPTSPCPRSRRASRTRSRPRSPGARVRSCWTRSTIRGPPRWPRLPPGPVAGWCPALNCCSRRGRCSSTCSRACPPRSRRCAPPSGRPPALADHEPRHMITA
jgi:hypothetical protein